MIKNDRQLGKPFGLFQNTKANIEALTGLTGGETAYATDTGEDGVYDAVAAEWVWGRSGGGAPLSDDDPEPVGETASPGVSTEASRSDHVHVGIDITGWIAVSETWTRTGNHTFTVSGDLTARYRKGTKVRYKDGGAFEYGVVTSSSYSAPNTTVNLLLNDDYAMAAATITETAISYIENPEGFPHIFNYSPTYGALGSMTYTSVTTDYARMEVQGIKVTTTILVSAGTTGGTASAGITVSLAYTQSFNTNGFGRISDGGVIAALVTAGSAYLVVRRYDNANFGLGSQKTFVITHIGFL